MHDDYNALGLNRPLQRVQDRRDRIFGGDAPVGQGAPSWRDRILGAPVRFREPTARARIAQQLGSGAAKELGIGASTFGVAPIIDLYTLLKSTPRMYQNWRNNWPGARTPIMEGVPDPVTVPGTTDWIASQLGIPFENTGWEIGGRVAGGLLTPIPALKAVEQLGGLTARVPGAVRKATLDSQLGVVKDMWGRPITAPLADPPIDIQAASLLPDPNLEVPLLEAPPPRASQPGILSPVEPTPQQIQQVPTLIDEAGFYDPVQKAVKEIPMKRGTGQQWINAIKKKGVSRSALEASGMQQWLSETPNQKILREDVESFATENRVTVGEKVRTPEGDATLSWPSEIHYTDLEPSRIPRADGLTDDIQRLALDDWVRADYAEALRRNAGDEYWAAGELDSMIKQVMEGDLFKLSDEQGLFDIVGNNNIGWTVKESDQLLDVSGGDPYLMRYNSLNEAKVGAQEMYMDMDWVGETVGTQWHPYTLGKVDPKEFNYREIELIDRKTGKGQSVTGRYEDYTGGHFDDPNVFIHAQLTDRQIKIGDDVETNALFVEALQPDWAQQAAGKGARGEKWQQRVDEIESRFDELSRYVMKTSEGNVPLTARTREEAVREARVLANERGLVPGSESVVMHIGTGETQIKEAHDLRQEFNALERIPPSGAFAEDIKIPTNNGIRRLIKEAIDNNQDYVVFANYEDQVAQWPMLREREPEARIDNWINPTDNRNITWELFLDSFPDEQKVPKGAQEALKKLMTMVGPAESPSDIYDLANKKLGRGMSWPREGWFNEYKTAYEKLVKILGGGVKGYYEDMMPSQAKKVGRALGGTKDNVFETKTKVGSGGKRTLRDIPSGRGKRLVIHINEKMKSAMKKGQPVLSAAPVGLLGAAYQDAGD